MEYDKERIKRDIPIEEVVRYYGLDTPYGRKVHCPNPEHGQGRGDKNPSANIGKYGNVIMCPCCINPLTGISHKFSNIDVVMLQERCSFPEALEKITENFGYKRKPYVLGEKEMKRREHFPISKELIPYLGLMDESSVKTIKNAEVDENGEIVKCEYEYTRYGLREVFDEDKEFFYNLVYGKILAVEDNLTKLLNKMENSHYDDADFETIRKEDVIELRGIVAQMNTLKLKCVEYLSKISLELPNSNIDKEKKECPSISSTQKEI